jgi:AcrR family transcriptional regulator
VSPIDQPLSTENPQRPLRADARRNRELILEAAQALFATDGLSVPLDDIARRAGVGPGTVHRHFPTKDALIAAVAMSRLQRVIALAHKLATAEDAGAALRRQLSAMLTEGDHSTPLKSALAGIEFDIRTTAPDAAAELRTAVNTLLQRAQSAGAIRADIDIDDLMATLAGTFHAIQHTGTRTESDRAQRLITLLFDSLNPTQRPKRN